MGLNTDRDSLSRPTENTIVSNEVPLDNMHFFIWVLGYASIRLKTVNIKKLMSKDVDSRINRIMFLSDEELSTT